MGKIHILEKTESLVVHYPEAVNFSDKQLSIFWTATEIAVEKDLHDILVNMTPAEKHGVMTVLKLFSLYELRAGSEYWGGRFKRMFPRPEFQRMAATFSMFELAVHLPFYNKINELLHVNTDDWYTGYVNDPVLSERMKSIGEIVTNKNNLYSLAAFSILEGAVLYSSFAFLKHFQCNGKNKLNNIVRGINFSVRDENLHSHAGAWAFNVLKEQMKLTEDEEAELLVVILDVARTMCEHEKNIVKMIFSEGHIDGITAVQMDHFVESRIDICLVQLGYDKIYNVAYNPIGKTFYAGISGFAYNDFFAGISNSYSRNWNESEFVW